MALRDIFSKFKSKNDRKTLDYNKEIADFFKKIDYLKTQSRYESIETETMMLRDLKNCVFNQEKNKINSLLISVESINNEELHFIKDVDEIIEYGEDFLNNELSILGKKKILTNINLSIKNQIKEIKKEEKQYQTIIKNIRDNIDSMKKRIRQSNFDLAETYITNTIELTTELGRLRNIIERKIINLGKNIIQAKKQITNYIVTRP